MASTAVKPPFDPNAPSEDVVPVNKVGMIKPPFDPNAPSKDVPKNNETQNPYLNAIHELANPVSAEDQIKNMDFNVTGRGLAKGTLAQLPLVGSVGGGLLGGIPGAGLGAAGGEALKQLGEKYLLGEDAKPTSERLADIGIQGALGAGSELGSGLLKDATSYYGEALPKMTRTAGENLTGIPKKAIETYQKSGPEVEALYKQHEGNFSTMADEARAKTNEAIFSKKAELNKTIDTALKGSNAEIEVAPIKRSLIDAQTHLDPKVSTDAKQITQINEIIKEIENASENGKTIPIQTANRFKASLQEQASQSYAKPGEVYSLGSDSARAAKKGAAEIRQQINKELPDLAKANDTHSKLHDLEDLMNINLIAEGKPEAALLAAGSGANQRNAKVLKDLGNLIDHDALGDAEKISAARYFGDPGWNPVDVTGKSVARKNTAQMIGSGIGAGVGGLIGGIMPGAATGGLVGHHIGGIASSPMALKSGIQAQQALGMLGQKLEPIQGPMGNVISREAIKKWLESKKGND